METTLSYDLQQHNACELVQMI